MAERPAFTLASHATNAEPVSVAYYPFTWSPGMSATQKRKNVEALHRVIREHQPGARPLEVSTKSTEPLGIALSAFNLGVNRHGVKFHVESLYQASKVFRDGAGPFPNLYDKRPKVVRDAIKPHTGSPLARFAWREVVWPLEPKLAFYTWLYCMALHHIQNRRLVEILLAARYSHFTDIEYNPKRTLNSQSFAVAYYVHLVQSGQADTALAGQDAFLAVFPGALPRGFLPTTPQHHPTKGRHGPRKTPSRRRGKQPSVSPPQDDSRDDPPTYAFDFA